MSPGYVGLIVGLVLGAPIGFFVLALCQVAGRADRASDTELYDAGFAQGHRLGYAEGVSDTTRAHEDGLLEPAA